MPKNKYRQEIEEILEKADLLDEPRPRPDRRGDSVLGDIRIVRPQRPRIPRPVTSRLIITPGRLFLGGFAVLLLSMAIRSASYPLGVIALALFGGAYYLAFTGMRSRRAKRHLRGDVIDLSDSWTSRFRRWFRGR